MSQVSRPSSEVTGEAVDAIDKAPAGAVGSVVVLCFGGLVASLMQTLIIPIQPDLPRLLDTSIGNASWIITATLLAAAVAMPIAGRLGDMFGKQRVLFVSAALLTLGSLICALGDTLVPLIIGRGVQGLAMGFIPVGMSLIREITPPRITSMAVAAMSATLGVGGAIGLPLAAWIVQTWDWHALFYVATGLGVLVSIAVLVLVPRVNDAAGGRIDIPGAIGLAVGLSAFLIAVSKANDWGWTSGRTLGLGLGGIAVLLVWGIFELRQRDPLVDLRTTARPAVLLTNIAAAAIGFGMMAQSIVLPMLLRLPEATGYGLGQSLLAAGLWMAPGGLMMMIFAPISGILINRIGAKITLAIGAAILGCGYLLAFFLMDAAWKLMLASIVCAIGVGVGYAAMPTLIMGSVPATEAGAAVGLNGLMRSLGTTIASAVMALILASATISLGGTEVPDESTFTWCFLVAAAAAFVGMAITLTIPTRRAASNVPEEQPLPARN
ncbi:MFS transporter [Gordonia terrae]|uniref:MFS transporter n=1 Tax=Gordonia terrae TaxID=2055 RepID=UPI003F6B163C